MRRILFVTTLLIFCFSPIAAGDDKAASQGSDPDALPDVAVHLANFHAEAYSEDAIQTLADLVGFATVHREGTVNGEMPPFQEMTRYLKNKASDLGFGFADYGDVVVISLGTGPKRFGIITHGDVQPADASKWARDPFSLDRTSEPGRLVGRGVEDDKGPIAAALYAMKTLAENKVALSRKIELIISYTEESDWEPFKAFLAKVPPPEFNVAIDAEYPVTVAEKGWIGIWIEIDKTPAPSGGSEPAITHFSGGVFMSQVPEDAVVRISPAPEALLADLEKAALRDGQIQFTFERSEAAVAIKARGVSAHSSTPWEGKNAITHLARLLAPFSWQSNGPSSAIRLIADLVGTGYQAESFGSMAFSHPFMGPLTSSLGFVEDHPDKLVLGLNLRAPLGKDEAQLEREIRKTIADWNAKTGTHARIGKLSISGPYMPENPPQTATLLNIFKHFTGSSEAKPISIGGGTHARLVPNGVNFGPAMPGEIYTGHSEHEFFSESQFKLNLKMYTAMIYMLAGPEAP